MKKLIFLADIDLPNSPQVRDRISEEAVNDYAEAYKAKKILPPPHLFGNKDSKVFLIGDGLHRIHSMRWLGRKAMECEVHTGDYSDALKYALTCNTTHGLRRSYADRRRAIATALKQWANLSNRQLAELCLVDDKTVASVRKELEDIKVVETTQARVGSDGKSYKTGPKSKVRCGTSAPEEKTQKKEDLSEKDETGYPIPKNLLPLWERRTEVAAVLALVSEARVHLEKADKIDDPLWREPFMNKAIAELSSVYGNLSTARPYAVCAICQGHPEAQPKGECQGCKGRGFMSKFRFERVPEKVREMRLSK